MAKDEVENDKKKTLLFRSRLNYKEGYGAKLNNESKRKLENLESTVQKRVLIGQWKSILNSV